MPAASNVLPFQPPPQRVATRPAISRQCSLPKHHADIGQLWTEVRFGGLWRVVEIDTLGLANPGDWSRVLRDVRLERIAYGPGEQPDEERPRQIEGGRWMRERNLLACFREQEPTAAEKAALRASIPDELHAFFGIVPDTV